MNTLSNINELYYIVLAFDLFWESNLDMIIKCDNNFEFIEIYFGLPRKKDGCNLELVGNLKSLVLLLREIK